ncbi:hypothetical protein ACIBCM_26515 [Streptomyces sp. NPDC051018]|uniref:hypothetical protein n=1 Tax=Streptomyces sp. NPDC051018 TaxID=3365639 RepID=UPI0037A99C72
MLGRSGTRTRLAVTLAATALALGVAQAPASAGGAGAQWLIEGTSASGCSEGSGDYTYHLNPAPNPHGTYHAGYNLYALDSCGTGGGVAHLRVKYEVRDSGGWRQEPWTTIASSGSTGTGHVSDYHPAVRNMKFAICDYTSSSGNHNCNYVQ